MEVVNSLAQSSLTTWKIVVLLGISCLNIPEQNGIAIAERKHRHVVEPGLTLLFHAKLPLFTWSETFLTVVFLINRLPSLVLKNTPFHKIHGTHPHDNSLKVFGFKCFPYIKGSNKFSLKISPCVFIGYRSLHKGYRSL